MFALYYKKIEEIKNRKINVHKVNLRLCIFFLSIYYIVNFTSIKIEYKTVLNMNQSGQGS